MCGQCLPLEAPETRSSRAADRPLTPERGGESRGFEMPARMAGSRGVAQPG